MNKMNKYPNGYQEKIDYYTYRVNKAIKQLDQPAMEYYVGRLAYFMQRQRELNRKALGLVNN